MVINIIITMTLACNQTVIINKTKVWSANDDKALKEASRRCGEKFKDSPCLKKFIKYDTNRYAALCTTTTKG